MTDLRVLAVAGKLAQNAAPGGSPDSADADGYVGEPKWDGWRIIAIVDDDHVDFFSRSGKSYNGKLPAIEAELLANFPMGTVLDGEVVALTMMSDGSILNEWGTTQSVLTKLGGHAAASKVSYMVFDLLAHAGIDARPLPYVRRRDLLESIWEGDHDLKRVVLTPVLEPTTEQYTNLVQLGYEGMVLKRLDAPYGSGKREGGGWLKVKPTKSIDGIIMGFTEGQEGFSGMVGAIVFGQFADGVLTERGRVSGMDMRTRQSMTTHPEKWVGKVIEIAHEGVSIGQSDSGRFRFPRFKRLRPDRAPESVLIHDA